ncbi:MAG: Aspartyl/glutamyl-tRNA(Asn/Gln) amidotransferase subunit C [Thermoanaerobacterales bacterium 50_218]|nr:MAG: Aspartyl/glutamyl-tRNA(Asn/Gln) amidotransferase subunit C [Thermoanaerobacterales bacterium 50_218]HAA90717.1 Asp-tRNA(Asn)/Glu-tRNA(Gln) amidotransferase subunit GatB [Peptococcaceae bacterium]
MKLSRELVEHVSLLARLALSEDEKEKFRSQLSAILDYAEIINRVDTSEVEPTYHVLPLRNVTRPDEVGKTLSLEDALKNAPDRDGNYFRVPRII